MSSPAPVPEPSALPPDASDLTEMATVRVAPVREELLFNRYRRVRELGRGGMGVVLLAHDEVLDVPVALKLVPDLVVSDTEGIRDLKKEVLSGMALTHPGIVRVYSFEQDATQAAIIMEYVEGETLAEWKVRQPGGCFDGEQLRPWLEQVGAALDYAHGEARIAHRDIKPRNILLDRHGRVKLADFGISSSLGSTLSRASVQAGALASGTPPYMSPQQSRGERPSHSDDIYSLGATLYELLTGKPPFFRGDIFAQVVGEVPPAMAARRAELGVRGKAAISRGWEELVAACLAKDSKRRPESGAAMLQMLDGSSARHVVGSGTEERPKLMERVEFFSGSDVPRELRRLPEQVRARSFPQLRMPVLRRSPDGSNWIQLAATLLSVVLAGAIAAGALHAARAWVAKRPAPMVAAPPTVKPPALPVPTQTTLSGGKLEPARGINTPPEPPVRPPQRPSSGHPAR